MSTNDVFAPQIDDNDRRRPTQAVQTSSEATGGLNDDFIPTTAAAVATELAGVHIQAEPAVDRQPFNGTMPSHPI